MKRGTPDHPKTEILAMALGIDIAHAVGLLEMLWHFTAKFSPAGDIGKWPHDLIAKKCGWITSAQEAHGVRTRSAQDFIDALMSAKGTSDYGFVKLNSDGVLIVHDWPDHCDDSIHMTLARRGEFFADGSMPRTTRLKKEEREEIEAKYLCAQKAHKKRTRSASATPSVRTAKPSQAKPLREDIGPAVPASSADADRPTPAIVQSIWNSERLAEWPACQSLNDKRRKACNARLKEFPKIDDWREAIGQLKRSQWWLERKDPKFSDWFPTFDYFLRSEVFAGLIEKAAVYTGQGIQADRYTEEEGYLPLEEGAPA